MACKNIHRLKLLCRGTLHWHRDSNRLKQSTVGVRLFSTKPDCGKKYTPRRALTYVPGNDERKLLKVPSLNADSVVMDCEDGVAVNRKVGTDFFEKSSLLSYCQINLIFHF